MELTYLEAISDALRVALREDERVILLGEDIGALRRRVQGDRRPARSEFGPDRVIDTPICEEAIIGSAVGAAIVGMRPVCEMQFADFVACALRPARQRRRQAPLPPRSRRADRRAPAVRRRLLRRAVPLAEPRGVVHALTGAEGARAVERRRTPRACCSRAIADPNPVLLPRAQAPLPARSGARCPRASTRRRSRARTVARRRRPRRDRLRRDGARRAGGDRAASTRRASRVLDLRSLVPLDEDGDPRRGRATARRS